VQGAGAHAQVVQVVAVADGDTIVVLAGERRMRVRLAEIDAPERGQPWNRRARQALGSKIHGMRVRLEPVDEDRYGRLVAHVWLGNRHINRELVREGHAWVYERYLVDGTLLDDEAHARGQRLGLWSLPDPVPPWVWRRATAPDGRATAPARTP
jgi:endonuclease YncB( thermonuclease family)